MQRYVRILQRSGLVPALVLLLGLAAAPVRAGVVIETKNFAGSATLTNSLTLPHFDDTLGILSSVKVSYTVDLSGRDINQIHCESSTTPCHFLTNFELSVTSPVMLIGSIALTPRKNERFTIDCQARAGESNTCMGRASIHAEGSDVANDLATLQLFDGPDDLFFNFMGRTSPSVFDINMSGWATIEYTYDERVAVPVPEPGTLAVTSLALLALAAARRRRRGRAI